ncbi:Para-aminobenzoate synthase, aminase component [Arcticibacter svalbardensis MN12-7]|uniref:Para-aminobenzoate synthase, aminase component n=1 Tax=Arcticibacter svalbardensis MN12-7 TaxID=1150600 RepID=R9GXY4_9SPHI|nr:anthranilate synthase component I family protein [Arcticibacter svalbardensis]EOR96606.1 Para-aminobenzoate synthase, aminase component [Arcticibacter svalbardensis MN12-7]
MQPYDCTIADISKFKRQALQWATSFDVACFLDSNHYTDSYSSYTAVIAAGVSKEICLNSGNALEELSNFLNNNKLFIPGFFSYDLKNEIEQLDSNNQDDLEFPDLYFFVPKHLLLIKGNEVRILTNKPNLLEEINAQFLQDQEVNFEGTIQSTLTKEAYIDKVNHIKEHIKKGDIYEMTFCQQFFSDCKSFNPLAAYLQLNSISPAPFSTFFKMRDKYIISSSPERFIKKEGLMVISQPIKGTAARSADPIEDNRLKEDLRNNLKEQAENIMIVDLVRNDLTRTALPGTVEVKELCGIYSFEQVHQMISTITAQVSATTKNIAIIKNAFPMGSMTGAPKIRAMELIELYEETKRGIYSGSVGYFDPKGNFDFNVIIRSLIYNESKKFLSFQVGSAITFASDPEQEYQECMLKAKAMLKVLS